MSHTHTIKNASGDIELRIERFSALDGWDIQAKYVEFAMSKDHAFRRAFTLEILQHVSVVSGPNVFEMKTAALIENHLRSWENVKIAFEEALKKNGIDPETHAEKPHYWDKAGQEFAISAVAQMSELVRPMLAAVEQIKG